MYVYYNILDTLMYYNNEITCIPLNVCTDNPIRFSIHQNNHLIIVRF